MRPRWASGALGISPFSHDAGQEYMLAGDRENDVLWTERRHCLGLQWRWRTQRRPVPLGSSDCFGLCREPAYRWSSYQSRMQKLNNGMGTPRANFSNAGRCEVSVRRLGRAVSLHHPCIYKGRHREGPKKRRRPRDLASNARYRGRLPIIAQGLLVENLYVADVIRQCARPPNAIRMRLVDFDAADVGFGIGN